MSARPLPAPYLITGTTDYPDRRRRISYLLASGRRRSAVIDQADDSPELRAQIGEAFAQERRRYNPARSRTQPGQ